MLRKRVYVSAVVAAVVPVQRFGHGFAYRLQQFLFRGGQGGGRAGKQVLILANGIEIRQARFGVGFG